MKAAAEEAAGAAAADVAEAHTGRCQCGAVTYRADGLRDIWYCHCRQCRRATGHYMAACRTEREHLMIDGDPRWGPHSHGSQIGFCGDCGSPLFWQNADLPTISVIAGSLDHTDGLATPGHIYAAEKGEYYMIDDGLPTFEQRPDGGC